MKIVVKEYAIEEYLVYLMTDTNIPIKCEVAVGVEEKKSKIFDLANELLDNKNVEDNEEFNLNYTNYAEVSLEDFINAKVLNEPTYG